MAERRMFAKTIIDSDAFLDMPTSAQLLYFHLGMEADDDGFVNRPKQICRKLRRPPRDLQALVNEEFLLNFEGIVVLKHFRVANTLKNDRAKPLNYPDIAKKLVVLPNRWYSTDLSAAEETLYDVRCRMLMEKNGFHPDSQPNRTEQNRKEENINEESGREALPDTFDQLRLMGGTLGKGVVLLSEQQTEALLSRMGLDAFDFYVEKLANYLLKNNVKINNHYATILKWYEEDKEVRK